MVAGRGPSWGSDASRFVPKVLLVGFALLGALFYWFNKVIRGFSVAGDVSGVWQPFAQCVLDGGRMYICHKGNKPPGFHLVNLAFAATGEYLTFHFLAMGLANGVTALLLWRFARRHGYDTLGFVAALLFVGVVVGLNDRVNPRSYANVFLFVALLTSTATRSSIAIAVGTLFSQYSAFLIPLVLWQRHHDGELTGRWIATFVATGVGTTVAVFGLVGVVWGLESAVTGVRLSVLSSGEYVAKYGRRGLAVYGDPVAWVYKLYRASTEYIWLYTFALVGVVAVYRSRYDTDAFGLTVLIASTLMFLPLTIRTAPVYFLAWFPFLSLLATLGLASLFERLSIE